MTNNKKIDDLSSYSCILKEKSAFPEWEREYGRKFEICEMRDNISDVYIAKICSCSLDEAMSFHLRPPVQKRHYVGLGMALRMTASQVEQWMNYYGKYPSFKETNFEDVKYKTYINSAFSTESSEFNPDIYSVKNIYNEFMEGNSDSPDKTYISHEALNRMKESLKLFLEEYIASKGADIDMGALPSYMRALLEQKAVPIRKFLIVSGMIFGMKQVDIDILLSTAGMPPALARDRVEAMVLILAVFCALAEIKKKNITDEDKMPEAVVAAVDALLKKKNAEEKAELLKEIVPVDKYIKDYRDGEIDEKALISYVIGRLDDSDSFYSLCEDALMFILW